MKRAKPRAAPEYERKFSGQPARSAEVISLRPHEEPGKPRDLKTPICGALTTVEGDHLSMPEIAWAWSKAADDEANTLNRAIGVAFWRGAFESGGQTSLVFTLQPPDTQRQSGNPIEVALAEFMQRRPGDYATRGGLIVKVGADSGSNPTADRLKRPIFREAVAVCHFGKVWRGLTSALPEDFDAWSDEQRDIERPNWRAEYEAAFLALSTIPFARWPANLRERNFPAWLIECHDFRDWYKTSPLSAGVPLRKFWPVSGRQATPKTGRKKTGRKKKYTPEQLDALRSGVFGLLDEYGDPESDKPHPECKSKEDLIDKVQEWAVRKHPKDFPDFPARTTIQPFVDQCLEDWRKRHTAGN